MIELSLIQKIIIFGIPLLFAITLHEVSHGLVAKWLGDRTAEMMGRLTVNPIKHIDPVGTIAVPLLFFLSTSAAMGQGMVFGWAKPVPVNTRNLKKPREHMAIVAIAGPVSNLLMALFWALVWRLLVLSIEPGSMQANGATDIAPAVAAGLSMAQFGILINVFLAFLNLLPVPPLDGGRVAVGLLPRTWALQLARVEPYGFIIVIALIVTPAFELLLPIYLGLLRVILTLVGIPA
ncbi:MAG: site-2 protease family protein [Gammaproteobacteria bacterium]|nr:site-2 protease family protein [Gammaproteobacteria bacterium]